MRFVTIKKQRFLRARETREEKRDSEPVRKRERERYKL